MPRKRGSSSARRSSSPSRSAGRARPKASSGRSSSSSSRSPARARPSPSYDYYYAPSPTPKRKDKEAKSGGFVSSVKEGMGWTIGNRVVDAFLGPRTVKQETVGTPAPAPAPAANSLAKPDAPAPTANTLANPEACDVQFKAFYDCVNSNHSEIAKCQFFMDMLHECKKTSETTVTLTPTVTAAGV